MHIVRVHKNSQKMFDYFITKFNIRKSQLHLISAGAAGDYEVVNKNWPQF